MPVSPQAADGTEMVLVIGGDGTLLRARSYARFPGPHGFVYRQLVIGSRAHRILLNRLLHTVARGVE